MSFILVPKHGGDLQINGWNWRPTLALLLAEGLLTEENFERMGAQGCGGKVDAELAWRLADAIEAKLLTMKPGERMLADLSVTDRPDEQLVFTPGMEINEINPLDLYSATYEWLVTFRDFCRRSGGFDVC